MCLQQDYNFTVFLHVKQSENYEQCYDDKCLSPTELQREWSVSDWDCLSTWLQDDIKVMHKNPMIQLEFLSLSQSCHLKLQEGTFCSGRAFIASACWLKTPFTSQWLQKSCCLSLFLSRIQS